MRVELIAPFRTVFNLNSEFEGRGAARYQRELERVLAVFDGMQGITASCRAPAPRDFRKFESLSADQESHFAKPVYKIEMDGEFLRGLVDHAIGDGGSPTELKIEFFVEESALLIFDNTIGIATASVSIRNPKQYLSSDRATLDKNLNWMMSRVVRLFQSRIIEPLIRELQRNDNRTFRASPRRKYFLLPPEHYQAFDDVGFPDYPVWPTEIDPLLWVNRTIVLDGSEGPLLEAVMDWAHVSAADRASFVGKESARVVQVGTNLFFNDPEVQDFLEANKTMQYFYTLFELLNQSQRRMYVNTSSSTSGKTLRNVAQQSDSVSSFIDFVVNEYKDYQLCIQSARKRFNFALEESFDLKTLLGNLQDRKITVRSKLEKLLTQRDRFMRRAMEGALVTLGAVAILDFALNLSVASRTNEEALRDNVPGLIDLVRWVSTDALLNSILAFIFIFAILHAYRRK